MPSPPALGPRHGAAFVAGAGAIWAALLLWLHARGHAPSRSVLPIPADDYYFWQALFVIPTLLACWTILTWVSLRIGTALGGHGEFGTLATAIAVAYAAPLAFTFVLPELFAFALFGFDALRVVIRFTAPLSGLVTLVLCTRTLARRLGLPLGRALVAAIAGLAAQGVVAGVALR